MSKSKSKSILPNAPAIITAEQLAGLSNLTKRRLYQLADEHKIPVPVNGSWPMLETITFLFSYYQRDGQDLQRERLLKTSAERKLREFELGQLDGRLCDARIAQNTINAALKKYHSLVRSLLEKVEVKKLDDFNVALGLSDEHRAALREFHTGLARATVDAIEDACERIGRGEGQLPECSSPGTTPGVDSSHGVNDVPAH